MYLRNHSVAAVRFVCMLDVIIVGGGPAGLSAALVLGRCRRNVLVCDAGHPRNEASKAMHGFLSRDGMPPGEFLEVCRKQLERYDGVELRKLTVVDLDRHARRFEALLDNGERVSARIAWRFPISTGARAIHLPIQALAAARWPSSHQFIREDRSCSAAISKRCPAMGRCQAHPAGVGFILQVTRLGMSLCFVKVIAP